MDNSTGNAPLLRLAQSPEHMQAVLLHADVAPWAFEEGAEPLDLRKVWSDVVALESDHGGFIFHNLQDGIYEVHTAFLPCEREAFPRACESVRLMFTYTNCQTVLTKVPEDNTRAWKLAEKVGFGLEYVRPQAYRRNGQLHDVRHYALRLDTWLRKQNPSQWASEAKVAGNDAKGRQALRRLAIFNNDKEVMEVLNGLG